MIKFKDGDLLSGDCNVMCHQVNCQGVMGSGIAKTIRDRFPRVYQRFLWRHQKEGSHLGDIDIIYQEEGIRKFYIVNLYSQDKYLPRNVCHTDYDAFRECLRKLRAEIEHYEQHCLPKKKFKIGFPDHIGCGLAGGDWNIVLQIIKDELADCDVVIYKLNKG